MEKDPYFQQFLWPIIAVLSDLGGSATSREVLDILLDQLEIPDDERSVKLKNGVLRVVNQVAWAGIYLRRAGLIERTENGQWTLTKQGWMINPSKETLESAYELTSRFGISKIDKVLSNRDTLENDHVPQDLMDHLDVDEFSQLELRNLLRSQILAVTPGGFELLCARILTELGLSKLKVVGGAGDRGIDIEGRLRVNPVVSFRVGVQCKLYADGNKIDPRRIREFQGALGPFDRGIYMTSGVFTRQAEEVASAPGYKPIDLVDGERLVEILLDKSLGVKTQIIVDEQFFMPFRNMRNG